MRKNISPTLIGVRAHPLVEHAAVNRGVVGSSPTRGALENLVNMIVCRVFCCKSSHIKTIKQKDSIHHLSIE